MLWDKALRHQHGQMEAEQAPPGVAATLLSPHPLHPLKGPDSSHVQ